MHKPIFSPRVPLVRKKSLRKNLVEKGLLKDYLKTHTLNRATKYFPKDTFASDSTESLENYLDVSEWAGGRSSNKE